jgi:DNA replication and repair protein RecF
LFIKKLKLNNFRNYNNLELETAPGINVIYGKNGLGKTNIVEAMFLCAIGKSFRTSNTSELIKFGEEKLYVEVNIEDNLFSSIKMNYDKKKQKSIKVDGVYISKMSFLMGKLIAVMFSPENMKMISEGPSYRRKFMDIALCQLSAAYYNALLMYNKALKEKKALLCDVEYGKKVNKLSLEVYNETLAEYGAVIYYERIKFIDMIGKYAADSHKYISGDNEELRVKFMPESNAVKMFVNNYEKNNNISKEEIKKEFLKELNSEKNVSRETERRSCLIGPHLDDIEIFLNDINLKNFGSQGQKRTAVVSIKHAELQIMKTITGRVPVLFLDDVMSELDVERKKRLMECVSGVQTFITCADNDIVSYFEKNEINVNYIDVEKLKFL